MTAEWNRCGSGFIEADVIRWNEGVWQKPRRRRGRAVNIGDRVVVAEVIRDEDLSRHSRQTASQRASWVRIPR